LRGCFLDAIGKSGVFLRKREKIAAAPLGDFTRLDTIKSISRTPIFFRLSAIRELDAKKKSKKVK
jgi:hypothetical protein